jgi:hypothetical protein
VEEEACTWRAEARGEWEDAEWPRGARRNWGSTSLQAARGGRIGGKGTQAQPGAREAVPDRRPAQRVGRTGRPERVLRSWGKRVVRCRR